MSTLLTSRCPFSKRFHRSHAPVGEGTGRNSDQNRCFTAAISTQLPSIAPLAKKAKYTFHLRHCVQRHVEPPTTFLLTEQDGSDLPRSALTPCRCRKAVRRFRIYPLSRGWDTQPCTLMPLSHLIVACLEFHVVESLRRNVSHDLRRPLRHSEAASGRSAICLPEGDDISLGRDGARCPLLLCHVCEDILGIKSRDAASVTAPLPRPDSSS